MLNTNSDAVRVAFVWKLNSERNVSYPDGTPKTFYPGKSHLNQFGYGHRTNKCPECGMWECDPQGIGHYRG